MRIILILLLFTTSLFAQYPSKHILPNGDTIIAITPKQCTKLNLSFVELDFYKEQADTLKSLGKRKSFILNEQSQLISTNTTQLKLKQEIINNDKVMIGAFKEIDIKNRRQIKWLQIQRNVLAITLAVAIVKILL